jgi:hypothetical protein
VDWLIEYNTTGLPSPTTNQTINRGSFLTQVQINPSPANNGTTIDDTMIKAELSAQIQAGNLPAPTHDAQGNNNTYYAVFFPHGKVITLGGSSSCSTFCAYHGTIPNAGGQGEIYYGVHPDFQPGSGCEFGCGAATTQFGNYTQVASHELVETITDAEIGLATSFGPPLAWYDSGTNNEIGDLCNDQNAQVVGGDGVTYDVQTEFSNSLNNCIVTNPNITPMTISANEETCRGTDATATVTVFGGAGRFASDVTLSLLSVTPVPPAGGEITATFDPNPVPAPTSAGSTSTMRISSTALTPPGTYTLTVQGASTGLTATTTTTVVIRGGVPVAPTLTSPPDNADGVAQTPTFTWAAADQVTGYTLDILSSDDCSGTPLHSYNTATTTFTVPKSDALPAFQFFSWRVSDANACGTTAPSSCFHFRTASCGAPHDIVTNGGFESGQSGWNIDANVPPPVIDGSNPHSGTKAVLLGSLNPPEPLGDAQISQVLTVPNGTGATLTFWEWPKTQDTVTFDQQYVRVTPISPAGPTVALLNEARNDQTYVQRSIDMSQFAGMTVLLTFGVHQDGFGDITAMYIDDVSLTVQSCGPPEFTVQVTPSNPNEVCAGNAITYNVSVISVNGPNFTSPVTLGTTNLPPGATATFAQNPVAPGASTTLTLQTTRPTTGNTYSFNVTGVAVTPPPDGTQVTATNVLIDANTPNAPELVSPHDGDVNLPRRPTLSWTAPFVPDTAVSSGTTTGKATRAPFTWELAAPARPKSMPTTGTTAGTGAATGAASGGKSATATKQAQIIPYAFGASTYHVQVASDAAFTHIVAEANTSDRSFTVPVDLNIATEYFWRVTASNACGTSAQSTVGSFIVGACFEGWQQATDIPIVGGSLQSTVVASPSNNKLYVIGGGTGAGPDTRINQNWMFDPTSGAWTHKTDVPAPGIGSNFGSATELNGKIYLFGGINGPPGPIVPHRVTWIYDIASDTWTRGADLPTDNFGAAVAAIGGKIYVAYGSGFATQTWMYDPAANTFTRKADAPVVTTTLRLHAAVLGGKMHAFAGGFEGNAHVIYNPSSDSWSTGAPMPFTATDPAVGVLGGKAVLVGGRPVAHNQIFDPATGTWSQGAPISGATTGVDNTSGAVLGLTFHVVGGFNGTGGTDTHWQLHPCTVGTLSSAAFLPFAVDGNGSAGTTNDRTALLLDNGLSGNAMNVSCFVYGTNGKLIGNSTIPVAANELKTVSDIIRSVTNTTTVQNKIGSIELFSTEVFQGLASIVNNVSADPVLEDGQPISGSTSGFVPTIGGSYLTQTVFSNVSSATALVELVAYPAEGGDSPAAASVAVVQPHGVVSYADVVHQLGLPATFSGSLSWSSNKPIGVLARSMTRNKQYSGIEPGHSAADASSTVLVPYVEDTTAFATALEIGNPGAITANVTVSFVDVTDTTGESGGTVHTRDIPIAINYGTPIADVVRWALGSTATTPTGKRGFVIVTTPQSVTAQARIVDTVSSDPAVPESESTITNGVTPVLVRFDPFSFAVNANAPAPAAPTTAQSRFAISNPGSTTATVSLTPYNATGSTALPAPFVVTVAPNGQYSTEDLAKDMGLPPVFLGAVSIQSTAPVLIYNHRRTGQGGSTVPAHSL